MYINILCQAYVCLHVVIDGFTEMFEACNSGDKRKLDKLVSSHPDLVNGTLHDDGSTLLHRFDL